MVVAATELDEIETVQKGSSLLKLLWKSILKVIIVAAEDLNNNEISVKAYLANFFRTFTLHLLYFRSEDSATVLSGLANAERSVVDRILVNNVEGKIATDFLFYLSFLPLSDPTHMKKDLKWEYFQVLKSFCIQGDQAVVEVQEMIIKAMNGTLPLIGRETGFEIFKTTVLLGEFSLESQGKREKMFLEDPVDITHKKRIQERRKIGLSASSKWVEKINEERTKFWVDKTNPQKLKFKEPEDTEFDFEDEDVMVVRGDLKKDSAWELEDGKFVKKDRATARLPGEEEDQKEVPGDEEFQWQAISDEDLRKAEDKINKILIQVALENNVIKVSFDSRAVEWEPSFTSNLLEMVETINDERAVRTRMHVNL